MKKIVSTMFKCGAICASLNTAFADEVFERLTEDRLGLIADERLTYIKRVTSPQINEATTTHSRGSNEAKEAMKKDLEVKQGSRLTVNIVPLKKQERDSVHLSLKFRTTHPLSPVCDDGNFDGNLTSLLSKFGQMRLEVLNLVTSNVINHCKNGISHYSLFPDDILIHMHWEWNLYWTVLKESTPKDLWLYSNIYNAMQVVDGDPRKAFAYLVIYVSIPGLTPYFVNNEIRVTNGKFERFSGTLGQWIPLPENNFYVNLATLLYNKKISLELFSEYLKNPQYPEQYLELISELEDSVERTLLEERNEARRKAQKYDGTLFYLVHFNHPELLYTSQLLEIAERGDKRLYEKMARNHKKEAAFLRTMCSAGSIETCSEKNCIQVSKEVMEMFEEWVAHDNLVCSLQKAARKMTPEERSKALQEAVSNITQQQQNWLNENYPSLSYEVNLIRSLDLEDKQAFFNLTRIYPEIASKLIDECRIKKIQFSPASIEILNEWITHGDLFRLLQMAIHGITHEGRSKALREAVSNMTQQRQDWLNENFPELLYKANLVQSLDLKDEDQFFTLARIHPEIADELVDRCKKHYLQISPDSMAILKKWFQPQESKKPNVQSPATVSAN